MKSEKLQLKKIKREVESILTNGTELNKRDNGKEFYCLAGIINQNKDYMDILFKLGFEVEDYYYKFFNDALNSLWGSINFDDFTTIADLKEYFNNFEYYDYVEADIYTHELLQWVVHNLKNQYYCDEVLSNYKPKDFVQLLQIAQTRHKEEVFSIALNFIVAVIESMSEDSEKWGWEIYNGDLYELQIIENYKRGEKL